VTIQDDAAAGVLAAFSDQLADAVERAGRSVVRVDARRRQPASGVVWGAGGLILTADHVLEREEDLAVALPGGTAVAATIVGRDPGTDVALLRVDSADGVDGAGLTPIERGPAPRVGNLALLVARPGRGVATSSGVVSALGGPGRTWRGGRLEGVIWTDASFYPGFSGGPLVDTAGRMIGMATSQFGSGSGLAIPVETLERVTAALQQHGTVRRGYLGVSSQAVELPEALRQKVAAGQNGQAGQESALLVVGVESGGPADRGGVIIGDLLVALGGQPVRTTDDLLGQLGSERVGQATPVKVLRGGEVHELTVTVGQRQ
jgi:S1-C subfamily serine protease